MGQSSIVTTLFEGDYHLGAAALINSLYRSGYRGTIVCGHRGPKPFWANLTERIREQIEVQWSSVPIDVHLTYQKPEFMRQCWSRVAPEAKQMFYFDPDIVVKTPWNILERWARDGLALCEDVNSCLPAGHPYRLAWLDFFARQGLQPMRTLERYYNAGSIGVPRTHAGFLDTWSDIIDRGAGEIGSLAQLKNAEPHTLFHSADQDALNMSLLLSDVPINAAGPEAMDFLPGGHLLSHAAGGTKPWRGGFLRAALLGRPPSLAQKQFFDYARGPLPALGAGALSLYRAELKLAALIGRFYRRN